MALVVVEVVVAAFVDIVVDTENYDFQYLDIPLLAVVVEVVVDVDVASKVVESGIAPFVHLPKGLLQLHIVVVVVVVAVAVVVVEEVEA